ncbi:MAG: hypothetical protein NTV82_14795 [Candidatus Aminicenantes bacterium]|nr:hypothetical protein [Candidatus Aminicenantes bacterium]
MKAKSALIFAFLFLAGTCFCLATVNKSIHIADNQKVHGGLSSVNGSIHIGNNCTVGGESHTVNGRIEVGDGSRVDDLRTVNGSIRIGRRVMVDGLVKTTNGSLACDMGTEIMRELRTTNGSIKLTGTKVGGGLTTTNGDVAVLDQSRVRGDIVIRGRQGSWFFRFFRSHRRHPTTIRIEGGSVVEGGIIVEDDHRNVEVIVSKDSKIQGKVVNAKIIER